MTKRGDDRAVNEIVSMVHAWCYYVPSKEFLVSFGDDEGNLCGVRVDLNMVAIVLFRTVRTRKTFLTGQCRL